MIQQATRNLMKKAEQKVDFVVPTKLYRIGELVRYTPFSRQTIHNYTTMGLIRESQWSEGGHRLYDESVFQRLSQIVELRKSRTLAEIKKILSDQDSRMASLSSKDNPNCKTDSN